jgi:Transglycosylase SLT domain
MKDDDRHFRAALPEEACLDHLMILRFGAAGRACPACGSRAGFSSAVKARACTCDSCGHALFPALGTPLEKRRTSLTEWFLAIHLMRTERTPARELERRTGLPRAVAERILSDLKAFAPLTADGAPFQGWLDAISGFVEARLGGAARMPSRVAAPPVAPSQAKTIVEPARPPAPGRRPTARTQTGLLLAAGLLGAGLASAAIVAVMNHGEPVAVEEDFAPSLSSTPPLPSLTLAAVEEDLAAARAAVESVTKAPAPPVIQQPSPAPAPAPRPDTDRLATTGDPNDVLTFGPIKVRRHLVETIVRAAQVVEADPTLLMAVADKESSFATEVKAKTSSATGLYQFIERTWLGVVAEFGAKHGLDREARTVVRVNNQYTVPDPVERARILDLRREPYLSALLAGEMLKKDTLRIEKRLGRHLTGGEIYLVHFLGPEGAQTFIDRVEGNPDLVAAELLPKPAEANKSIFYDKEGGRSVSEVHRQFEQMIGTRLERYREVRRLSASIVPVKAVP